MSNNYNKLEKYLASILKSNPKIKSLLKKSYSRLVYVFYKKKELVISDYPIVNIEHGTNETFFGYYDKYPENACGDVIFHSTSNQTHQVPNLNPIKIVVVDKSKNIICEFETKTYNWQQGSRSHWLDDDNFIYNDISPGNKLISNVVNIKTKKIVKSFNYPVQDSYEDEYFLSLNYRRLQSLRPDYGYRNNGVMNNKELMDVSMDGIFKVDMLKKEDSLIVSFDDIFKFDPQFDYSLHFNKVNHIMISPNGDKFIFMHRCLRDGVRIDRLLLADNNGKIIRVLADNNMVSHCCWINNDTILGYLKGRNGLDKYWVIETNTVSYNQISNELINSLGDGHPTVVNGWMISDTYPDKARFQTLFAFNLISQDFKILGKFKHSFLYDGESRCDLHPRASTISNRIYFDNVSNNKRSLSFVEVDLWGE